MDRGFKEKRSKGIAWQGAPDYVVRLGSVALVALDAKFAIVGVSSYKV